MRGERSEQKRDRLLGKRHEDEERDRRGPREREEREHDPRRGLLGKRHEEEEED